MLLEVLRALGLPALCIQLSHTHLDSSRFTPAPARVYTDDDSKRTHEFDKIWQKDSTFATGLQFGTGDRLIK